MVDMFEIFEVAVPESGVGEVPAVTPHEFSCYLAQSGHPNRRSPAFARDLVAEHLARWGLTSLVDDGRTVVSELATNAIRHALPHMSGRVLLRLVREPTGVLIVVFDPSRELPRLRFPDMWAEGGFGLAVIVDQVTGGRWGVEMFPDGKAVWARLSHPPVGSHPTAEEEAPWPQRRLTAHRTSDWGGSRPQ